MYPIGEYSEKIDTELSLPPIGSYDCLMIMFINFSDTSFKEFMYKTIDLNKSDDVIIDYVFFDNNLSHYYTRPIRVDKSNSTITIGKLMDLSSSSIYVTDTKTILWPSLFYGMQKNFFT